MAESMKYLLIDGHSIIFAWPQLRALHQIKTAHARQELIKQLQRLHDTSSWRVTLVFDGRHGAPTVKTENEMVVAYSKQDETADSIIEKLVAAHSVAKEILVVTADEAERRTVESLGAFTASPDWLQTELGTQEIEFQQTLNRLNRRAQW